MDIAVGVIPLVCMVLISIWHNNQDLYAMTRNAIGLVGLVLICSWAISPMVSGLAPVLFMFITAVAGGRGSGYWWWAWPVKPLTADTWYWAVSLLIVGMILYLCRHKFASPLGDLMQGKII